jgi:hypothetical protein
VSERGIHSSPPLLAHRNHACCEERCAPRPEHPLYGVGRRELISGYPRAIPGQACRRGAMFSGPALERYDDEFGCPPSLPERKDPSFSKRRIPGPEYLLDRGRRRKFVSGNPSGLPFLTLGRRVMFASPSLNRRDDLLSRPSPFVVMTARKSRPDSDHGSATARTRHQAHNFNFGRSAQMVKQIRGSARSSTATRRRSTPSRPLSRADPCPRVSRQRCQGWA